MIENIQGKAVDYLQYFIEKQLTVENFQIRSDFQELSEKKTLIVRNFLEKTFQLSVIFRENQLTSRNFQIKKAIDCREFFRENFQQFSRIKIKTQTVQIKTVDYRELSEKKTATEIQNEK